MKKGFASFPSWPEKVANAWGKSWGGGHPIAFMPDPLRLQAFRNAFKVGTVNFANSLSLPSIVKKYAPEVKTAKGLKLCWVKVKGVNNLTWSTSGGHFHYSSYIGNPDLAWTRSRCYCSVCVIFLATSLYRSQLRMYTGMRVMLRPT